MSMENWGGVKPLAPALIFATGPLPFPNPQTARNARLRLTFDYVALGLILLALRLSQASRFLK
jgi:hypothetical protein